MPRFTPIPSAFLTSGKAAKCSTDSTSFPGKYSKGCNNLFLYTCSCAVGAPLPKTTVNERLSTDWHWVSKTNVSNFRPGRWVPNGSFSIPRRDLSGTPSPDCLQNGQGWWGARGGGRPLGRQSVLAVPWSFLGYMTPQDPGFALFHQVVKGFSMVRPVTVSALWQLWQL